MSKASYETFQKHAPIPREYFDQKKTSTETRAFIFSPKVSGQDAKDISGKIEFSKRGRNLTDLT
jgi:hypothetical protein